MAFFSTADRERVRKSLLARADADPNVVGAAVVGSEAEGRVDRFSDIDLTLAVRADVPVEDVLEDWTGEVITHMNAAALFDLPVGATIYRVFLLPGCLQVDLSFSPAADFGATGSKFRLLFGEAVSKPWTAQPDVGDLFGRAVHHAVRARFSIERERWWQAEYWIAETRQHALAIACLRHDLGAWHARTADQLPRDLLRRFEGSLVLGVDREHLLQALLGVVVLLRETADDADPRSTRVDARLAELLGT